MRFSGGTPSEAIRKWAKNFLISSLDTAALLLLIGFVFLRVNSYYYYSNYLFSFTVIFEIQYYRMMLR
jgi:hypothetical protein